jgi:hypothetical protein
MEETAADTVRAYYRALREGDRLAPFFREAGTTVKFGIGERLSGYEEISEGLAEQTATTTDWTVESRRLVVEERDRHAWFSDDVRMAWTDAESGVEHDHETRWSGTLEWNDGSWEFAGMHVSCRVETDEEG